MLVCPQGVLQAWVQGCSTGQVLRGPTQATTPTTCQPLREAWLPGQGPACGSLKNEGLFSARKQVTVEKMGLWKTANSLL